MFPCRCGHGFLRKEEEEDSPSHQGAKKKKQQKDKPKLNVSTKLVSQKVVGEYFPEVGFTEKAATIIRRPVMPVTSPRKEPPGVQPAKVQTGAIKVRVYSIKTQRNARNVGGFWCLELCLYGIKRADVSNIF